MNSYKCSQCGLVNWQTATACKRCGAPNNQQHFAAPAQPVYAVAAALPNPHLPPPPNYLGDDYGRAHGMAPQPHIYYQAPEAPPEYKTALKQIRNAWICGIISCVLTIVLLPVLISLKVFEADAVIGIIIELIVFAVLTVGVYFKSRACAVLLFSLFLLDKIVMWIDAGKPQGILVAIIFLYYFAYGIQGTFTYQKLKKQHPHIA